MASFQRGRPLDQADSGGGWRDQGKFSKGIRKQNELHRLRQRRGEEYRLIWIAGIWVTRADVGAARAELRLPVTRGLRT